MTTPSTPPQAQSSSSDYMVGVEIGQGAFGNVLFGRHKTSNRDVAIKVVPKLVIDKQPAILQSLLQERTILTNCNDESCIVSLFASFHDEQCLYLVMECATRGTLTKAVETYTCSADDWKKRVVPYYTFQILKALEYLHNEQRIIHADLKPDNILVAENGQLQLCDFGSAIILSREGTSESTAISSMPRGTSDYAAPEIIRNSTGDKSITPAVDLWSLACVVVCMLTGESPFHAASDALCIDKIMAFVQSYHIENGSDVLGNIPPEFKPLVRQLLHPDPTKRGKASLMILQDVSNDPPYIPPYPPWWNGAHSQPMRDGSQGWTAFLVD